MTAKTDRELLELAAKAAGMSVRWHESSHYGPTMEIMEDESGGAPWNPLTDDGDALRLAVKLRFLVEVSCDGNEVRANSPAGYHYTEICGNDPCAATRIAIVNCAAYIGRDS